jgi:hypothetical protein
MKSAKALLPGNGDWQWIRVYYFEDCKDDLILDAIWPVLNNIVSTGLASGAFFKRDWIAGPNVLIGLKELSVTPIQLEQNLQPVREYLQTHPSRSDLTAAEFQQRNKLTAELELRRTEDVTLNVACNNTVVTGCEEPSTPLVYAGSLQQAMRQFLCRSSRIVVNWLELVRTASWQRQQIAMDAMVASIWVANPETLRSHISYNSHAHGFLRFMDIRSGAGWQEKFSKHYTEVEGEKVRRSLAASVEALQGQQSPLPGMIDYLDLLRETMTDIYTGLQDGRYLPLPIQEAGSGNSQVPGAEVRRKMGELVRESIILQTWRATINFVYLMLNQLGLAALERYLACYLITRAAEDLYQETAASIVEELARSGDVTRVISFFQKAKPATGGQEKLAGRISTAEMS